MTLIVGHLGSMGKRYQAILNYLGEPFHGYDTGAYLQKIDYEKYDQFIIASPTNTHMEWIKNLDHYGKQILCEKPITKDPVEIEQIRKLKSPLTMQMQYAWLVSRHSTGRSYYDYYNHGQDGLAFDCFQIIALANGPVELYERSPIWKCTINGTSLRREEMDAAYVTHVRAWLSGAELHTPAQIINWHDKVHAFSETRWTITKSV